MHGLIKTLTWQLNIKNQLIHKTRGVYRGAMYLLLFIALSFSYIIW